MLKLKRSRIICSIITIIYLLLLVYIGTCLVKNSIDVKSGLEFGIKAIYIVTVAIIVTLYMFLKKRLSSKIISTKLMNLYKYTYFAVVTLVSRISMVYMYADRNVETLAPAFSKGLGSYVIKLTNKIVDNSAFTNILINTVITFIVVLLIKEILLNITKSDFLASLAATLYIFLPQSIYFVTEYNRYNFNLLFVLSGTAILIHIIDVVKQYKLKSLKYIYLSILLGSMASMDIILGGSVWFWVLLTVILSAAATYIDIAHISFGQRVKSKMSFKFSKLLYKLEQTNFSKLINTTIIVTAVCGITTIILNITTTSTNYIGYSSISELADKLIQILTVSRNYYIVLITAIVLLEIISVVLKRTLDIKMICIKILNILVIITMILSRDLTYTATIFDVTLILLLVSNLCNIYYNREEKIKLLKEKN